jgi:chemotaxis response regulator CheB
MHTKLAHAPATLSKAVHLSTTKLISCHSNFTRVHHYQAAAKCPSAPRHHHLQQHHSTPHARKPSSTAVTKRVSLPTADKYISDLVASNEEFDVVVIGAGIGGLSCAALLAYYGLKVSDLLPGRSLE